MNLKQFTLGKMNFSLEARSKIWTMSNKWRKAVRSAMENNNVSSANCRWFKENVEFSMGWVVIRSKEELRSKRRLRELATKMNKKGDDGSPCLIPHVGMIFPLGHPLLIMLEYSTRDATSDPSSPKKTKPFCLKHNIQKIPINSIKSLFQIKL